jgi:hypothetical protein
MNWVKFVEGDTSAYPAPLTLVLVTDGWNTKIGLFDRLAVEFFDEDTDRTIKGVTHWMHLPQLPEDRV